MGARRDSKIVAKRSNEALQITIKKKEEDTVKRLAVKMAKLKAKTNRILQFQRGMKEDLEEFRLKCARIREQNHLLSEYDARIRRDIDLLIDIIDPQHQGEGDPVRANNLNQSFSELMEQQNEEKQAFAGCGSP